MTIRAHVTYQHAQVRVDGNGHLRMVHTCSECGAMVQQHDWSKHTTWHRNLAAATGNR